MARLSRPSLKALRRQIDELCRLYTGASPELAERVAQRKSRQEAELDPAPTPVRHGAIYHFDPAGPDVGDRNSATTAVRPKSLSLPDYYEVAHLLVRHYRITKEDLALLPPSQEPPR
jgi:hypothetical protein